MAEFQHRRQRHLGGSGSADPGDPATRLTFTVPPELDGERFDKVVAVAAGVSRSGAASLIESGAALVNGVAAGGRQRLSAGDEIAFPQPQSEPDLPPDPTVPFDVVYEDDSLAVVSKPSGVAVHPGAGRRNGTLANGLLARWPEIEGVGEYPRWGIVHRLDLETSGLLVVARTAGMLEHLQALLRQRAIHRTYQALVHGRVAISTGTIDAPIRRDPDRPVRMAVHAEGRPARTHYTRRTIWGQTATLLDVTLETGRTHQIRVHLASIGHAVFDDRLYGSGGPKSGAGRLWLHAAGLSFVHPDTGVLIELADPLPEELLATLHRLGEPDSGRVDAG